MPNRVVPMVPMLAWVAFVAALAVYVATSGPADNDLVYHYQTEVDASVDVVDPAFSAAKARHA